MLPFAQVNLLAVLLATAVAVVIGFVWYSPVAFGTLWMRLTGIDPQNAKGDMSKAIAEGMLSTLAMVYVLALLLAILVPVTFSEALTYTVLLWAGLTLPPELNHAIWEGRPVALSWINAGHILVSLLGATVVLWMWA